MNFKITETELAGVYLIEKTKFNDERGYFMEFFREDSFNGKFKALKFVQDNLSFSKKGTVRGLHFQKHPYEQGKLVYAITGSIFDVAVDLRIDSGTFGKYISVNLSEENHRSVWIPPGFGHGFMALEDSHVMYKVTNEYNKEYDSGIVWNDPDIGIVWPDIPPIISDKDRKLMSFEKYKEEMGMVRE